MSSMQIDSVLAQIRSMSAQIKPISSPIKPLSDQSIAPVEGSFSSVLSKGLSAVNQTQKRADALATDFQLGKPGVELADVMIEMQKASVSFRGAVEVRNRMISAYQDIMNMQV